MRKQSKKYIFLPAALAVYSIAMAVIGYPSFKRSGENMYQFWGVLAGSLALALTLHFILKRREKNREKFMDK